MSYVLVKSGFYRKAPIKNTIFRLVREIHKDYGRDCYRIRVHGGDTPGYPDTEFPIRIPDEHSIELVEKPQYEKSGPKSDDKIKEHISSVFSFANLLVEGAAAGKVRSVIISGGAGVGKSYTVENTLRECSIYDRLAWDEDGDDDEDVRRTGRDENGRKVFQPKYTILKGATSAVILYATLHRYSAAGEVLVLDDSDSVFLDVDSLNILKAALDTGKKRFLTYSKDSHVLKERGVPQKFEYKGSIIFISNVDFEHHCESRPNSNLTPHLKALMSRCHYLDVGLHDARERLIQVQLVQETSKFLSQHGCSDHEAEEVIDFMSDNVDKLREVSLRSAISIAEKRSLSPNKWRDMTRFMEFKKQYRNS